MNLQAIKRACNEAGGYTLITDQDGQQWIGNGAAFWPVEGITLTEGAIPVVFDFSKRQREETMVRAAEYTDPRMTIEPMADEWAMEEMADVLDHGRVFKILRGPGGLVMIDSAWIKPAQKKGADLRYFLRAVPGRQPLVAIYADMLCGGIVMPMEAQTLEDMRDRLHAALDHPILPCGKQKEQAQEEAGA